MVREGQKHSESVRRGSAIGRECQNMRPEPGVAHQRMNTGQRFSSSWMGFIVSANCLQPTSFVLALSQCTELEYMELMLTSG